MPDPPQLAKWHGPNPKARTLRAPAFKPGMRTLCAECRLWEGHGMSCRPPGVMRCLACPEPMKLFTGAASRCRIYPVTLMEVRTLERE